MLEAKDYVTSTTTVCEGQSVFKGTEVPVNSLFLHLESGSSLDQFLESFPTVNKIHAIIVLEIAGQLISSQSLESMLVSA